MNAVEKALRTKCLEELTFLHNAHANLKILNEMHDFIEEKHAKLSRVELGDSNHSDSCAERPAYLESPKDFLSGLLAQAVRDREECAMYASEIRDTIGDRACEMLRSEFYEDFMSLTTRDFLDAIAAVTLRPNKGTD